MQAKYKWLSPDVYFVLLIIDGLLLLLLEQVISIGTVASGSIQLKFM